MVVKNITATGPSGNIKPIPVWHPIPPTGNEKIKVTIDTSSGEIDVSDLITQASFNLGVTSTIGDFTLTFIDPIKENHDLISLFNDVYLYSDYGTEATTKRFRFKVERKGFSDFKTTLSGSGIGMILSNKSIIYQSLIDELISYKNRSDVIIEIIQQNFPDITDFSHIEEDTTQVKVNYSEIPFYDIIEEHCGNTHYFYLDKDLIPYYFTKGSVKNTTEAITSNNLVTIDDNAEDGEEIYTRVRIYGYSSGEIPIISTKDLGTTITGGIDKDYIINNTSIITQEQADDLALQTANELQNSTRVGSIVCLGLPSLTPGDSLFIGLPEHNLPPGYYNIKEFSINIDNEGNYPYLTNFNIEKRRLDSPTVIKDIIQTQNEIKEAINKNDLDFSLVIDFSQVDSGTTYGTHDGTSVMEGKLVVTSGSVGTWISPIFTLTDDISIMENRWYGDNLVKEYGATSALLFFSLNGGVTWKPAIVYGQQVSSKIPTGRSLRYKVVFNSSDQNLARMGSLYSL